jgi:hypothetical protein
MKYHTWLWTGCAATTTTTVALAKLADRSRVVQKRLYDGKIVQYHDNGRPLEGPQYRVSPDDEDQRQARWAADARARHHNRATTHDKLDKSTSSRGRQTPSWMLPMGPPNNPQPDAEESPEEFERKLSSQLSGCCSNYQSYQASYLCSLYGNDCSQGSENSHDSGDQDCEQNGLSFIGVSFSVNTASGNPYSYQLCDQFPMENIIDRDYEYVMSMDEDGWLVGGGYKTFDYSGKMPYVWRPLVLPFVSTLFSCFFAPRAKLTLSLLSTTHHLRTVTLTRRTRSYCASETWTRIKVVHPLTKCTPPSLLFRSPRFPYSPNTSKGAVVTTRATTATMTEFRAGM